MTRKFSYSVLVSLALLFGWLIPKVSAGRLTTSGLGGTLWIWTFHYLRYATTSWVRSGCVSTFIHTA